MGTSSYKYPVSCRNCGHAFEQTKIDTDDDFRTHYLPDACPRCGGKSLGPFDPLISGKRTGDKSLCGRCQGTRRNFGPGTVRVTNAPDSVHNNWCHTCVSEVNEGAKAVIPGVSIDREGFVVPGTPPSPKVVRPPAKEECPAVPAKPPEERLASVTNMLVVTACVEAAVAVLLLLSGVMVALTPKDSPSYDPTAPHPVFILGFCACALARAYFLVRWSFAVRARESHRTAVRAAGLAAVPFGGCCFVSTPVGLWALCVLHDSAVTGLFAQPPPALAPNDTAAPQDVDVPKVSAACPRCARRARVSRASIGKRVRCKGCGHAFVVSADD